MLSDLATVLILVAIVRMLGFYVEEVLLGPDAQPGVAAPVARDARHDPRSPQGSRRASHRARRLLLKACPRCHGDLLREPDGDDGSQYACLQCGWSGQTRTGVAGDTKGRDRSRT